MNKVSKCFKRHDVVTYSEGGVAIVDRVDGNDLWLLAWGGIDAPAREWIVGTRGLLRAYDCKHHPDPDSIWAKYTAACLAGEIRDRS